MDTPASPTAKRRIIRGLNLLLLTLLLCATPIAVFTSIQTTRYTQQANEKPTSTPSPQLSKPMRLHDPTPTLFQFLTPKP